MSSNRGQFSSSIGFVMAAAGSAIGLGNVWSFPTLTAQNGGAGFVFVYIVLMFLVGFPLLIAEFVIGRNARSNPVGAYQTIKGGKPFVPAGFLGLVTIGVVLSFYCIVAGKMAAYFFNAVFKISHLGPWAQWVISDQMSATLLFTTLFFLLTLAIISVGVKNGIEKWSMRLMPLLLVLMVVLVGYVLTLPGAIEGVKTYLLPDFSKVFQPNLLISALGQAFFTLGLGVGGMMVLASYTAKSENLVRLGLLVTFADLFIAFLAGMLIIPAMFAASNSGVAIYDEAGALISGPDLIFQVLPILFDTLGSWGLWVAMIFFLLMSLAALTSSIAMMEVPTAYLVDNIKLPRKKASWVVGLVFWAISVVIILNMDWLFGLIVMLVNQYILPLLGIIICIFAGWVMNRNTVLQELAAGNPKIAGSWFMKTWRIFVTYITPLLILTILLEAIFH